MKVRLFLFFSLLAATVACLGQNGKTWIEFEGKKGPGKGKTVVLISGDEEYRSEETMPQFAKILSEKLGFHTIVLFAIDPKDGTICPNINDNIPGLENLIRADLAIMLIRWRNLPDSQMKYIVDYVESGKPIMGMRTSTHPFNAKSGSYLKYNWDNKSADYEGGFGRQVFGETWVAHHGEHAVQGTRGVPYPNREGHPILTGIKPGSVFGPTDVYAVRLPLPTDCEPLLTGQVTESLDYNSPGIAGPKNNPMMPIAWTKSYRGSSGKTARVFMTTMGSSQDFTVEGTRRMLINAALWTIGLEKKIDAKLDVALIGQFVPSKFAFKKLEEWKPGKLPVEKR